MRRTLFIVCLLVLLLVPAGGWAYQNEIAVGLEGGSGDYKEPGFKADVSTGTFLLGYSRYLKAVETNDTPYGERVFLQHPSFLNVYLLGYSQEIKGSGVKDEYSEGNFGLGGMYYLPSNTGIGLTIVGASAEETLKVNGVQTDKDETDGNVVTIEVGQYVTENVAIGASYEMLNMDQKDDSGAKTEISGKVFELSARGLINKNFAVGAYFGTGDQEYKWTGGKAEVDVTRFGLELGFYPSQQLGLFLRTKSQVLDMSGYEETDTAASLSADYYFNEQAHLDVALSSSKNEVDDVGTANDYEITATAVGLTFGYLF